MKFTAYIYAYIVHLVQSILFAKFIKSLTEVLLIKQSHKEPEYLRQDDQPNTHLMGFLHYRCLDSVTVLKAVYQHDSQMFT